MFRSPAVLKSAVLKLAVLFSILLIAAGVNVSQAAEQVDYLRDVKPILQERCYACHGVLKQSGGLRLDTAADLRRGGDSGDTVQAAKPEHSLLLQVVMGTAGYRMPPADQGSPLSEQEIAILRSWVAAGAPAPAVEQRQPDPHQYWSYRRLKPVDLPPITRPAWIRTPIDAFIAARHDEQGLSPNPEAARETWLRRVYYDLIGLPPTREELQAFLKDDSPIAYDRVVDDLLNRPQYGERWGRHWMDVWRYSDWYGSRGNNEIRYSQRHIWRWRDWIVESLNADRGYDQMVREMLAGDELAPENPDVLRATGYLARNWYKFDRNVWMFDVVEHTSQAFLGMTMRCARCHDHKFDPISQQDYYQLRAFFEPHQVRTETLSLLVGQEKDATLGMVPKDGVARVFDRDLETPTYLFERGDDRFPDKKRPLLPAVPASLGSLLSPIEPVELPLTAYYPALRPQLLQERLQGLKEAIKAAEQAWQLSQLAVQSAERAVAAAAASDRAAGDPTPVFLQETFNTADTAPSQRWKILSGDWVHESGRLRQNQVGHFHTMITKTHHPPDFRARAVYRPLQPGTYRSVGFSFDYRDPGNSQDVYTSTGDSAQSVQAFHRQGGRQVYPPAGIVPAKLAVNQIVTLEWEVRGSQLRLWLNGEHQLDYVLPVPRQPGHFAVWVHAGAAEFHSLEITALTPTLEDRQRSYRDAVFQLARDDLQRKIAQLELDSLQARIAAEQAKYAEVDSSRVAELALTPSQAVRRLEVARAELLVLAAEQRQSQDAALRAAANANSTDIKVTDTKAKADVEQQVMATRATLEQANRALESADGTYESLGETYPTRSTGRRRALAEWITQPDHPRTARIAVNQIWMRHFGQPLVASVANFGMNGAAPTHPELLDWLAVELVANGWRMKPLHRMLVLSATYRQSSSEVAGIANAADPRNQNLWRMNSRRMQAEVVRDSVLALSGALDLTMGGPEISEKSGELVLRRSLYFRNTPNERMGLLAAFDIANPNQCYRRQESVVPEQALALMNSGLVLDQARKLAATLSADGQAEPLADSDRQFVMAVFQTMLNRSPTSEELQLCLQFLTEHVELLKTADKPFPAGGTARTSPAAEVGQRARENLVHVLFNHNDFVTIR